jgi:CheY-like chemotaxis protein
MAIMKETFSRSIALSQHVEEGPWSVLVDRTQLHQVVLNLCVNARDAMPEGGRLSVGVFNILLKEDDPLLPQGAKPGPYVRIEVADTGRGIDPAIKDRIFDPFFTTKPMGQGTGLGLSTALGIVRSHGGFIKVDSTPGAGSVFNVFLPATEDAEQTPAPPAAGDPGTGRDHHILVVDDEAAVREMMRAALGLRGYRVTLAANGEEGLARFREHSGTISLVITDLMMPVMDGAALIEAVRRIDPRVPIVASSGLPELDRLGGIQASGVQAFLPKPFSVHALMQVVGKQLAA